MIPRRYTKRRSAVAGKLGKNFVMRLAQGLLIDRNIIYADGKARKKIAAPAVLRGYQS